MELLIPAAIGLFAGVFGGLLGVGGSVIIIPAMIVYLDMTVTGGYRGHDQHLVQAAAMITNVFVAAPSVLAHWRARAIMKPVVVLLVPSALAGIITGVAISNSSAFAQENGVYLGLVLAGFLAYVVFYNTCRLFQKTDFETGFDENQRLPTWKVLAVGLPMGLMAGLLGVGGGAICVPLQQFVLRLPLRRAIANSATTIVFSSLLGATYKNLTLSGHDITIGASLRLAALLIPTAIVGSYVGGKLTHLVPKQALRLVFIVFMAVVACVTFSKAWTAIGGM